MAKRRAAKKTTKRKRPTPARKRALRLAREAAWEKESAPRWETARRTLEERIAKARNIELDRAWERAIGRINEGH
jgi:hypothetical protein